jgi:hypothetical protein
MKKLFLSFLLASFFSLTMAGTASAANWVWAGSDDKVGIFFDSSSIKFDRIGDLVNGDIACVWWYMVYDDAYAQSHPFMGKTLKKIVLYDKLHLEKRLIRNFDAIAYDENGDVIYRGNHDKPVRIIPGSHQDVLFNAVARYIDEHLEEVKKRSGVKE